MPIISISEHALNVAKFHSNGQRYGWNGLPTDLPWAKRYIDRLKRDGEITPQQAHEIRRKAGWTTQLSLL